MNTLAPSFLIGSFFSILAGKEDMHESLDEEEFLLQICNRVMAHD